MSSQTDTLETSPRRVERPSEVGEGLHACTRILPTRRCRRSGAALCK